MNDQSIVSVGIDWADAKHDFHLITTGGEIHIGVFKQQPKAIADQIDAWRKLSPGATFAVAIEATKGAIINALLEFDDVQIYPVNPAALANYRKAFAHGGGKNDPVDAQLLAQFLAHYRSHLRPLTPNSELTRKIATIAEDRRRLVDQRADLANELTALLKRYESQLKQLLPQHGDFAIVKWLPGAAFNMQARMIAALGDDRSRYPDAASLQAASGIAPVTTQSGRQRFVNARWACTKFMKQTFHEFAGLSINRSRWAKAFYEQQRSKGKSAQMSRRDLAYRWQRIIFRLWQSGEAYDEDRYIARLNATGSPLYKLIESAN